MQSQIRLAEETQAKKEARARKRASMSSTARSRKGKQKKQKKQDESQIVNAFESVSSVVVAPAKRDRGRPRKKENIDR